LTRFAPIVILGFGLGAGRCPGTDDNAAEMSRPLCRLRLPFQTALPFGQFARLIPCDCAPCAFNEKTKVRSNAVRHPKQQLHCRIAKPPFNQAQHGFGNARTLCDGVVRELSAFALSLQKPNDLFSDAAPQKTAVFFASDHLPGIKRFHEQPRPTRIRRVVVRRILISPASTFCRFRVAISAFSANSSCVMPRRTRSRRTFAPKARILDHSFLSRGTTYYIADAEKQ